MRHSAVDEAANMLLAAPRSSGGQAMSGMTIIGLLILAGLIGLLWYEIRNVKILFAVILIAILGITGILILPIGDTWFGFISSHQVS